MQHNFLSLSFSLLCVSLCSLFRSLYIHICNILLPIRLCVCDSILVLVSFHCMPGWCARTGNLDFENLSNSLYDEWNKCDRINTGSYSGSHETQSNQKNRLELESVFVRVGLQAPIAAKVADEVYEKLGLRSNQSISFNEFLTLIQCDTDLGRQQQPPQSTNATSTMSTSRAHANDGDVYRCTSSSNIIIDDSMVNLSQIDLHAHSGLSFVPFFTHKIINASLGVVWRGPNQINASLVFCVLRSVCDYLFI